MKIGLIRHFEVERGYPNKIVSTRELMEWTKEYDASNVIVNKLDLKEIEWKHCFSSDLYRAKETARKAFDGKITYLEELREVQLSPFFKRNLKLPLIIHLFFIRAAWYFNHKSQIETKQHVLDRINHVLDKVIETNEDALIVGHGGIMLFMRKELLKRGFRGSKMGSKPANGKLYIFER